MVLINGSNVKFLVNSTESYGFKNTVLPRLIASLRTQIDAADIVVVVGNSTTEGVESLSDYTLVKVKHNSMDFTALIGVIDNQSNLGTLPDYWFYMHDTCLAGANFISNLNTKTINSDIRVHWTSNLGIFRNSTLLSNSSLINSYKSSDNPNYIEDRVNKYKSACDKKKIFETINCRSDLCSEMPVISPNTTAIYNNVQRQTIYFEELDFYKYNSNFVWARRLDPPRFNRYP